MNRFTPDWRSLRSHQTPQWLRDAKFGIYTHWGIYSVPAIGPNTSWYGHNMYRPESAFGEGHEATNQYEDHRRTYGDVSKFGYKDFIPQFTAEKFDPDEWAEMFRNAGARFAGPVAEHHDGFSMWNTTTSKWNAAQMGPKRDVVGELANSIRSQGMKYMVAMHHAEHWWFFPHWLKGADVSDPKFADLYGELHNVDLDIPSGGWDRGDEWKRQDPPSKAFLDRWYNRLIEVVDGYKPDYVWFDFGLKFIPESYKQRFLAYYYNKEATWGRELAVSYKWDNLPPGTGLVDIELGRMSDVTYYDWITDTTIDEGNAWGYMKGATYKSATDLVHYLVDNVSKNGYMLLNVGPRADGTIPEGAQEALAGLGRWLATNGEAVYGTAPWYQFGEGPTRFKVEGAFGDMKERVAFTGKDIRFTTKGNLLYAIALALPAREFTISAIKDLYPGEVKKVELLGVEQPLNFQQTNDGLTIERPATLADQSAFAFKITRGEPYA